MSSSQIPPSPRRATFGDATEAAEFVAMLERFERGDLTAEGYRQYRLSRGVYGQRQDGVQMIRVKIPQGILSAAQLRVFADLSERYSRGYGHVTTRQNFQFHDVKAESVGAFLEAVAASGLTTREACSHTVRNVVGCPYAGVCGGEAFDVTPYGEAITRHFLRARYGSGLPRKFKITASGCEDDCAKAAMNDIGIVAKVQDGVRGFTFRVGGGTSTLPRSAKVLHDFLPASELLEACEAVVRVFNQEGERKNLHKARLKWAIERLGWEGFQAKYAEQREAIRAEGGRPLPPLAEPENPPAERLPAPRDLRPLPSAFAAWRRISVRAQLQAGFATAAVWLRLGDISAVQMRGLADLIEALGDGTVRTTLEQNLVVRWVPEHDLSALWRGLDVLGLGEPHAATASDVVSCPGAETCRIAVTASRGVAQLVGDHLRARTLPKAAEQLEIKVSGCPNGCGQHHVSAIGLQGGVRKLGDRLVPQYHLLLGGGVDSRGASFGRLAAKVPARRVPEAVDRLIALFEQTRRSDESPRSFFGRLDLGEAKRLLQDLTELTEATARPEDFVDPGSNVAFEVVLGEGECAA